MKEGDEMDAAMKTFLEVKERLNQPETRIEFNMCFQKPWRFYRQHTADECIEALHKDAEQLVPKR